MTENMLRHRRALVTGASRGIGRAIAVALATAGADVAITARGKDGLRETAAQISKHGTRAAVLPADLWEDGAAGQVVADAAAALGGLDTIINNAAWAVPTPFEDVGPEQWRTSLRLNLEVPAQICQAAEPHLRADGKGCVINIGSVAAFRGFPATPHYAAGKAGLISLTRSLAVHWAPHNIRVNALCPGYTATEMTQPWWHDAGTSAQIISAIPLRRWAQPEEMCGPTVFLASDAASYITGQVLIVDGGLLAA
ncbi:SDR family oxidoreductase [Streptomyces sp. NPDC007205]|uniref:SDR family NAD(P)-dependent oxidoreductase n=1 Tax=Streptomyces sp. NPDC007205 TaxID=3154316 RepID=UPI0033FFCF28